MDLRQSRIDINDVQKNMINKEISVKVIKRKDKYVRTLFINYGKYKQTGLLYK